MTTSSTSINDLARDSLAHIFAFLPPDERVRLERVCRHWNQVAKKYAWTDFRTLELDWENLMRQCGDLVLTKYRALLDRCALHLRELSTAIVDCDVDQWAKLRKLRHLRFDACMSSVTLRAVADNLKRLQSIHLSTIDWRSIAGLHYLLCSNNGSLQALRIPMSDSRGDSLCLPALPSTLRSLHITGGAPYSISATEVQKRDRIDELLELAASCCPQLAMLMLPILFNIYMPSLSKLVRFEKLFYLRLYSDDLTDANVNLFGNLLAKIGAQLRALLLGRTDSRVLHLIAKHCPMLEHYSFGSISCSSIHEAEFLSALQSMFQQLAHLRSVSISYIFLANEMFRTQILATINGLNAKGNIEYLHLHHALSMSAQFIINLIQTNHKLYVLTCRIQHNETAVELSKLNTLLRNMDRSMELELIDHCPPELEMPENSGVRVRRCGFVRSINKRMLRQFWAQSMDQKSMDSAPDLSNLEY